jgi:hypothetical protein
MTRMTAALAPLALAAVLALSPATSAASSSKTCKGAFSNNPTGLVFATVLSAKKVSCSSALSVVKKYGPKQRGTFKKGATFKLGSYGCKVTSAAGETRRARCTDGGRAFVVAWGL